MSTRTRRPKERRTPAQERARYAWLGTADFAEAIGVSTQSVLELVAAGWFDRAAAPPECMDVRTPGAKRAEYRFHARAVARYHAERAR
jgi:hypothetical protein